MASGMAGSSPSVMLSEKCHHHQFCLPLELSLAGSPKVKEDMTPALQPHQEEDNISFLIFPAKVPEFSLLGPTGVPYLQQTNHGGQGDVYQALVILCSCSQIVRPAPPRPHGMGSGKVQKSERSESS